MHKLSTTAVPNKCAAATAMQGYANAHGQLKSMAKGCKLRSCAADDRSASPDSQVFPHEQKSKHANKRDLERHVCSI